MPQKWQSVLLQFQCFSSSVWTIIASVGGPLLSAVVYMTLHKKSNKSNMSSTFLPLKFLTGARSKVEAVSNTGSTNIAYSFLLTSVTFPLDPSLSSSTLRICAHEVNMHVWTRRQILIKNKTFRWNLTQFASMCCAVARHGQIVMASWTSASSHHRSFFLFSCSNFPSLFQLSYPKCVCGHAPTYHWKDSPFGPLCLFTPSNFDAPPPILTT